MKIGLKQKVIFYEKNQSYKSAIRKSLNLGKPQGMSKQEWREYEIWARQKLKSQNPHGFPIK